MDNKQLLFSSRVVLEVEDNPNNNFHQSNHDVSAEHGEGRHKVDIPFLAASNGNNLIASKCVKASSKKSTTHSTENEVGNYFRLNYVEYNEHGGNANTGIEK